MGKDEVELNTTDRALCFFQATLIKDEARTARASLNQLRSAANALILRCAVNGESQGGIALNIGTYNSSPPSLPFPTLYQDKRIKGISSRNTPLTLFIFYFTI